MNEITSYQKTFLFQPDCWGDSNNKSMTVDHSTSGRFRVDANECRCITTAVSVVA